MLIYRKEVKNLSEKKRFFMVGLEKNLADKVLKECAENRRTITQTLTIMIEDYFKVKKG